MGKRGATPRPLLKDRCEPFLDRLVNGKSVATGCAHRRETLWLRTYIDGRQLWWLETTGPPGDYAPTRTIPPTMAWQWMHDNGYGWALPDKAFAHLGMDVPISRTINKKRRRITWLRWQRVYGDTLKVALQMSPSEWAASKRSPVSRNIFRLTEMLVRHPSEMRAYAREGGMLE